MVSLLAAAVFWSALFGFGALRPGYSQFTRAVSELGAVGAQNALAWNLVGFIVPGLLVAYDGARIARALQPSRRVFRWLLVLAGAAFAGTGVFPAVIVDGAPVMQAPSTVGHVVMLLLSSLFWICGVAWLLGYAWRDPSLRSRRTLLLVLTGVSLAGLAANVFHDAIPSLAYRPGFAQRLGFLGFFVWYAGVSLAVVRR